LSAAGELHELAAAKPADLLIWVDMQPFHRLGNCVWAAADVGYHARKHLSDWLMRAKVLPRGERVKNDLRIGSKQSAKLLAVHGSRFLSQKH
jgi:hypothetical protein